MDYSFQNISCPECRLEFPGLEILEAHISVSHKNVNVKIPTIEEISDNNESYPPSWAWENHSTIVHQKLPEKAEAPKITKYQCDFCELAFTKVNHLHAHVRNTHEIPKHQCKFCQELKVERIFDKVSDLQSHVNSIHEILVDEASKTFKCIACENNFSSKFNLNHHIRYRSCACPDL